jgi:hypothetical protein
MVLSRVPASIRPWKGVAMSDQTPAPGNSGGEPASEPDVLDEAQETAMMRAVMRTQEKHREGGIDPELDDAGAEPGA